MYAEAHEQGRQPTVAEITKTPVPYLEAIIEEVLRVSAPIAAAARVATVDTVVMGHPVPKGTTVFMSIWGPGITTPAVHQSEEQQASEDKKFSFTQRDDWDGSEPEKFMPERWLKKDEDGQVMYDAQAGPMLAFSLGVRGCFGRRLAYLTMRVLLTMLLWNFELDSVPEELDGWRAVQILTRKPTQCYVRLSEVKA